MTREGLLILASFTYGTGWSRVTLVGQGPLHIGFLKIWFIFKLETLETEKEKRESWRHVHDCIWVLGPHTSWEEVQLRILCHLTLPFELRESYTSFKRAERWERTPLNLEYSSWKNLTQTLKSWNIPNQPQFRTEISLMRLLYPETPCFLSPKRHDT